MLQQQQRRRVSHAYVVCNVMRQRVAPALDVPPLSGCRLHLRPRSVLIIIISIIITILILQKNQWHRGHWRSHRGGTKGRCPLGVYKATQNMHRNTTFLHQKFAFLEKRGTVSSADLYFGGEGCPTPCSSRAPLH